MKKRYKIGISVVVAVMLVIALIPVAITEYWFLGPEPTDEEGLKLRARQVFLLERVKRFSPDVTLADVDIVHYEAYFGCYNGCVVGIIKREEYYDWVMSDDVPLYKIEDYWFHDAYKIYFLIYKDGELYGNIEKAYEAKILTIEDIKVIYQKYYDFSDPDGERFNSYPEDPMNPNKTN